MNVGVDDHQGEFVLHHAPPAITTPAQLRITTHKADATMHTNHVHRR